MSDAQHIERVLALAACEPVALPDKEVWDWQRKWRHAYAGEIHAQTGKWMLGDYDWHVFSFGKCVHKQGDRAWSAFRRVEPGPFLVFSAQLRHTFGFCCDGMAPELLDCGIDIIVAPPSMEWTMAFNHERYGPYFAIVR
jgi:hypothetical protein